MPSDQSPADVVLEGLPYAATRPDVLEAAQTLARQMRLLEDETAVDGDWLLSVGGYAIPVFGEGRPGFAIKGMGVASEWVIAFYRDELSSTDNIIGKWAIVGSRNEHQWLPNHRRQSDMEWFITRGAVRTLCKGLGIALKEDLT